MDNPYRDIRSLKPVEQRRAELRERLSKKMPSCLEWFGDDLRVEWAKPNGNYVDIDLEFPEMDFTLDGHFDKLDLLDIVRILIDAQNIRSEILNEPSS